MPQQPDSNKVHLIILLRITVNFFKINMKYFNRLKSKTYKAIDSICYQKNLKINYQNPLLQYHFVPDENKCTYRWSN